MIDKYERCVECLGSLELVPKCQKPVLVTLLVWRLATWDEPPGDKGKNREALDVWRLAEGVVLPGGSKLA